MHRARFKPAVQYRTWSKCRRWTNNGNLSSNVALDDVGWVPLYTPQLRCMAPSEAERAWCGRNFMNITTWQPCDLSCCSAVVGRAVSENRCSWWLVELAYQGVKRETLAASEGGNRRDLLAGRSGLVFSCVVFGFDWCDAGMAGVTRTDKKSAGGGGGPFTFMRSRGSVRKEVKRQQRWVTCDRSRLRGGKSEALTSLLAL